MKYIQFILLFSPIFITAQSPLAEIEGRVSVYMPLDTTSIYIGRKAGVSNSHINHQENTFIGFNAGNKNTATSSGAPYSSGVSNSFFGSNAGSSNTRGSSNSFFGVGSGKSNDVGYRNSFYGAQSGAKNKGYFSLGLEGSVYAARNSFFGYQAGFSNESGGNNVFFGAYAGSSNTGPQEGAIADELGNGSNNTYLGYSAGRYNAEGRYNVFIGSDSGHSYGDGNVIIGYKTGEGSKGDNNILIGYNAGPNEFGPAININDRLYIDAYQSNNPLIYGEFDNDLLRINGELQAENSDILIRNLGNADSNKGIKWGESDNPAFGITYDGEGTETNNRLHIKEYVVNGPGTLMTLKGSGEIGFGTEEPRSTVDIQGILQLRPRIQLATDCDEKGEIGRVIYNTDTQKLQICTDIDSGVVGIQPGWQNLH